MKTTRKHYDAGFKMQAVAMVKNGRSVIEVARELEIENSCLYDWMRKLNQNRPRRGDAPAAAAEMPDDALQELQRLRARVQLLERENVVLKKAAVILGTEALANSAKR